MSEPSQSEVPRRELRDADTMRALSHPLRLRLYEELAAMGPATATELGALIGESATNCSWHLRQLARHGLVEEAGGGPGRRRPWRVTEHWSLRGVEPPEPAASASARDALVETVLGREVQAWRDWSARRHQEPAQWRQASLSHVSNGVWLTAEELAALTSELRELVDRHIEARSDRRDPANRPPGSRPARFVVWATPHAAAKDAAAKDQAGERAGAEQG